MSITQEIVGRILESRSKTPNRGNAVARERARVVKAIHFAIEDEHADLSAFRIQGAHDQNSSFPTLAEIRRPSGLAFDLGDESIVLHVEPRGALGTAAGHGCRVNVWLIAPGDDKRTLIYTSGHALTSRDGQALVLARHPGDPGAGEWLDLHPDPEWRNSPNGWREADRQNGHASLDAMLRSMLSEVLVRLEVVGSFEMSRDNSTCIALSLQGHRFIFDGEPGMSCRVETIWDREFTDDADRLAHKIIEANVLACFQAGVLWRDGRFDPAVVESLNVTMDQLMPLIEALDEDPVATTLPRNRA